MSYCVTTKYAIVDHIEIRLQIAKCTCIIWHEMKNEILLYETTSTWIMSYRKWLREHKALFIDIAILCWLSL